MNVLLLFLLEDELSDAFERNEHEKGTVFAATWARIGWMNSIITIIEHLCLADSSILKEFRHCNGTGIYVGKYADR